MLIVRGEILSATSTIMFWFTKVNTSNFKLYKSSRNGDLVDQESLDFEHELLQVLHVRNQIFSNWDDELWYSWIMQQDKSGYPDGLESFANVQRSAYDVMRDHAFKDSDLLGIGYVVVFIFVVAVLSSTDNFQKDAIGHQDTVQTRRAVSFECNEVCIV